MRKSACKEREESDAVDIVNVTITDLLRCRGCTGGQRVDVLIEGACTGFITSPFFAKRAGISVVESETEVMQIKLADGSTHTYSRTKT